MVTASQKKWGKWQESEQVLRLDVAVVVAATGLQLPPAACPAVRPLHTPSRLRHPEKQHCGHFRGGFGRRAGVPVGGVAAGFPVHPPDFRQHPQ